ncbi:MAG TPA: STAS domain-containing protein [Frankiaceae bacterium]|nr:STAS domain-containing protein [Frankiaceae bacterium]
MPALITDPTRDVTSGSLEPSVRAYRSGDGLVVRLSGVLDGQAVPELRRELLAPLPAACVQVLVDAGAVTAVDDDALAVLLAGSSWARTAGARFSLSAVSLSVAEQIEALELVSSLPVLNAVG